MRSFRTLDRRAGFGLSAFALLLAMVAPGLVPAFASADSLTSRSITLSNSSAGAPGVTYNLKFTPHNDADMFAVQFCDNSPLFGAACDAPSGFTAASAATSSNGAALSDKNVNTLLVTYAVTDGTPVDVEFTGITNPTAANDSTHGLYARVATYTTANAETEADDYDTETPGTFVDNGGVALAITNTIGVSAAVRESLSFCVASATITDNCANAASNLPSVALGDPVTGLGTTISTASLYAQISTNAAHGAVVNLKSSATSCGGLVRAGDSSSCDIGPSTKSDAAHTLANGKALFGLITGTATGTSGTFQAVNGYDNTTYFMDYAGNNNSGVTSAYGSSVLDTDGAPANNMNMPLTFGASAANDTPAGNYSASLSMIATGTY